MKSLRKFLSVLLVAAFLASGLPLFHRYDANRDRSVDLEDVILHVMELTEKSSTFSSTVENTLSSLYAVAGLKKVIQPENDKSSTATPSLDLPYLVPSTATPVASERVCRVPDTFSVYESIIITPTTPPPRIV